MRFHSRRNFLDQTTRRILSVAIQNVSQAQVQDTLNYLVPSSGTTRCIPLSGALTGGSPVNIDWRQFTVENQPFQPQGVYIDNTNGTAPLTIGIYVGGPAGQGALLWTVTCPAGKVLHTPYPAPNGQCCQINGTSVLPVTVVFVDYPVLPYGPV